MNLGLDCGMILYSNDNPEFKPLLRQFVEPSETKQVCKPLFFGTFLRYIDFLTNKPWFQCMVFVVFPIF